MCAGWPRTALRAELDASHISSNESSQLGLTWLILAHQISLGPRKSSRPDRLLLGPANSARRSRTKKPKVVKGDRLACHRTLVDLILSALANREITLRRLSKARNIVVSNSSNSVSSSDNSSSITNTSDSIEHSSSNNFAKQMENNNKRTLKELATPDVVTDLEPAQTYELKSGLIHLLPKFHGLAGEDPHKHLKEFHVVCSTMRP
ncbi:hypothetical protein CR513_09458, partial [Mucuna pruriens]